jgi:hypothetical protein
MTATARLVVQMTPVEKAALDRRARKAGVSTAEFVRRRVGPDDLDDRREEIEALLATIEAAAPAILHGLDQALERTRETLATLDAVGSHR